eukprot:TRINITY_DN6577_c0_g1_i2.p1 TRINITY_DN6577_c0_g1~~TRINITY_DN6577_c0_g1_i2.p1  ORF type:complete len:529 (+),score=83.61 TRINITY_DN6577_c0_g1_i2:54-1640(+)
MSRPFSYGMPEALPRSDVKGFRTLKYVCFVFRTEFELNGSPGGQGLALGDVDGDGSVELCVGSVDGSLSIFKHANSKAWVTVPRLGTILCVDVIRLADNDTRVAVLSAEGWCRLLSVSPTGEITEPGGLQRLPRNITNMEFTNISPTAPENAPHTHVILGGLDRTVYLFSIQPDEDLKTDDESQVDIEESSTGGVSYQFTLKAVYRVDYAVTSLAVLKNQADTLVLVGLSNSSYAIINMYQTASGHPFNWASDDVAYYYAERDLDIIKIMPSSGGVERSYLTCRDGKLAVATQDGGVMWLGTHAALGGGTGTPLFPKSPESTQHPLASASEHFNFSSAVCPPQPEAAWCSPIHLNEMLMGGISFLQCEGEPCLCLCTWGGDVYFIDNNKDAVRFSMHEPVRSFLQGKYSLNPTETKTCIFCTTFDGQIIMFTDIEHELSIVKNSQVTDSLDDMTDDEPDTTPHPKFHLEADLRQRREAAKRIRSVLYDITPGDITSLEAYKEILEARLSAQPLASVRRGSSEPVRDAG